MTYHYYQFNQPLLASAYQILFLWVYPFTYVSANQWRTNRKKYDVIKSNGSTNGEGVWDCLYPIVMRHMLFHVCVHYDADTTVCCFCKRHQILCNFVYRSSITDLLLFCNCVIMIMQDIYNYNIWLELRQYFNSLCFGIWSPTYFFFNFLVSGSFHDNLGLLKRI